MNGTPWPPPGVETIDQTCWACPEQYEGTLTDGRHFYLRYRFGSVELGIGATQDDAVRATVGDPGDPDLAYAYTAYGDSLAGIFDSEEARSRVVGELFARLGVGRD